MNLNKLAFNYSYNDEFPEFTTIREYINSLLTKTPEKLNRIFSIVTPDVDKGDYIVSTFLQINEMYQTYYLEVTSKIQTEEGKICHLERTTNVKRVRLQELNHSAENFDELLSSLEKRPEIERELQWEGFGVTWSSHDSNYRYDCFSILDVLSVNSLTLNPEFLAAN